MKKLILFLLTIALLSANVNTFATVANHYVFSRSTGIYNPLVGGTTVAISTHTSTDPFQLNDVTFGPNALPFLFPFNNVDYSNYMINTNGFITFGATAPVEANYNPISSSQSYEGAISAFGLDLIGLFGTTIDFSGVSFVLTDVANFDGVVVGRHITAATGIPANTFITAFDPVARTITISNPTTDIIVNNLVVQIAAGSISTSTQGIAPNRVHIIEFKNFRQYLIIGTDDNFNFQIKLFETTGVIHVVYGNMDHFTTSGMFGQTGLRGDNNTDYNNRTNSSTSNWATSTAGGTNAVTSLLNTSVFPESGETYIWTPDETVLPVEMSTFVSSVNRRDVTLNWTTSSEVNNSGFEIERSTPDGQWSKSGFIQGNGTTLSAMNYTYSDKNLNTGSYNYRLKQIDFNGNFAYFNLSNEVIIGIPTEFNLSQNYPNPFNPSTKINYDLPADSKVNLKLFDMSGKEVESLVNEFKTAGYYTISFNANRLSSGIYFYTLTSDKFVSTKKMMLIK